MDSLTIFDRFLRPKKHQNVAICCQNAFWDGFCYFCYFCDVDLAGLYKAKNDFRVSKSQFLIHFDAPETASALLFVAKNEFRVFKIAEKRLQEPKFTKKRYTSVKNGESVAKKYNSGDSRMRQNDEFSLVRMLEMIIFGFFNQSKKYQKLMVSN